MLQIGARKNPAYGAGFLNQQDSKSNLLPLGSKSLFYNFSNTLLKLVASVIRPWSSDIATRSCSVLSR
jgi:hypothetical protein